MKILSKKVLSYSIIFIYKIKTSILKRLSNLIIAIKKIFISRELNELNISKLFSTAFPSSKIIIIQKIFIFSKFYLYIMSS